MHGTACVHHRVNDASQMRRAMWSAERKPLELSPRQRLSFHRLRCPRIPKASAKGAAGRDRDIQSKIIQRSTRKLTRLRLSAYLRLTGNTNPGGSPAHQSPRKPRKNKTRDETRWMKRQQHGQPTHL